MLPKGGDTTHQRIAISCIPYTLQKVVTWLKTVIQAILTVHQCLVEHSRKQVVKRVDPAFISFKAMYKRWLQVCIKENNVYITRRSPNSPQRPNHRQER